MPVYSRSGFSSESRTQRLNCPLTRNWSSFLRFKTQRLDLKVKVCRQWKFKHLNSEQYLIPASYQEWEKNRTFLSASVKIFGAGFFVTALATSVFKRYIQKSLNYSQQVKFKGGFNTTLFSATMICSWPIIFTQAGVINYLVNREFVDASFPSFVMRELGKDNFWNFEITKQGKTMFQEQKNN